MRVRRLSFLLVFVLLLVACKPSDEGAAAGMSMRVYPVPSDRAPELVNSLNQALAAGTDRALGSVSRGTDGQLIVVAPESMQSSIETSLAAIVAAEPPESAVEAHAQLRLHFWSVDMVPGAGEDAAGLGAVAPALGELRKAAVGDVHFVLRDSLESVSSDDPYRQNNVRRSWDSPHLESPDRAVPQQLSYTIERSGRAYRMNITFTDNNHPLKDGRWQEKRIDTATTVVPGQTLILASQPVMPVSPDTTGMTRYYILRIDPVGAG